MITNYNLRPDSINKKSFNTGQQEDAAEFYASFIACLQQSLGQQGQQDLWNLLGTTLREQFECEATFLHNCPITSAEPVDYPDCLPLPVTGSTSVQESLQMLLGSEEFRERNCPNPICKSKLASSTKLVTKLPKILNLQMTRFTSINGKQIKLKHKIEVPRRLTPTENGPSYILTGAIIHAGESPTSGHYVSTVICPRTGDVFLCDDAKYPVVVQTASFDNCSFANVLERAYMLTYSLENETLEAVQLQELVEPDVVGKSPLKKKIKFTTDNIVAHSAVQQNVQRTNYCNEQGDTSTIETNQTQLHDNLPTTPYTSVTKAQPKETTRDLSSMMIQLTDMTREQLINYYKTHIQSNENLTNIRKGVNNIPRESTLDLQGCLERVIIMIENLVIFRWGQGGYYIYIF